MAPPALFPVSVIVRPTGRSRPPEAGWFHGLRSLLLRLALWGFGFGEQSLGQMGENHYRFQGLR